MDYINLLANKMSLTEDDFAEEQKLRNKVISCIIPSFLNNIEVFKFFESPFNEKICDALINKYADSPYRLEQAIQNYHEFYLSMWFHQAIEVALNQLRDVKDVDIGEPINCASNYGEFVELSDITDDISKYYDELCDKFNSTPLYSPVHHTLLMEAKFND